MKNNKIPSFGKILLLNPPNLEKNKIDAPTVPLGLLSIKEFIQQKGFDIEILNLYFEKSWEDIFARLKNLDFQAAGIACYTRQRFSVFKLAELIKKINKSAKVVLGGPHATFLDVQILEKINFVDFIVRNEGEFTFLELIQTLQKGDHSELSKIEGLTFRENGSIVRNLSRKNIENLSDLPPPKYSEAELDSFPQCRSLAFHFRAIRDKGLIAPILASRGCSYNCLFCCNGAYWKKQNYFSPEYVFAQLLEFNKKFNIKVFDFYDDNFLQSQAHVNELCDLIIKNRLDIHWWCSSRAQNLDKNLLVKIKKAGCFMVSYGLESGSQKILNSINKKVKIEEAVYVAELTRKAGLKIRLTVSIGHPGENEDSIKETISFVNQIKPDQIGLFLTKLYPGSPLYKMSKKAGFISDDYWFDSKMPPVPFYTPEISLEKMIEYRDMIIESMKNNIVYKFENEVYTLELDLDW